MFACVILQPPVVVTKVVVVCGVTHFWTTSYLVYFCGARAQSMVSTGRLLGSVADDAVVVIGFVVVCPKAEVVSTPPPLPAGISSLVVVISLTEPFEYYLCHKS